MIYILEMVFASGAYVAAFLVVREVIAPVQDIFFPEFHGFASLLFLPHGVRVLTAWLLGWRSVLALLPGVIIVYYSAAGSAILEPSRIAGILIAVLTCPVVFWIVEKLGLEIFPGADRQTCWPCVMLAGTIAAIASGLLTNLAFGSPLLDYIAFFIGDVAGLFFLMMILMFVFRFLRQEKAT